MALSRLEKFALRLYVAHNNLNMSDAIKEADRFIQLIDTYVTNKVHAKHKARLELVRGDQNTVENTDRPQS